MERRRAARLVEDPDELERSRLPLAPWAGGEKATYVRIDTKLISGRRLEE